MTRVSGGPGPAGCRGYGTFNQARLGRGTPGQPCWLERIGKSGFPVTSQVFGHGGKTHIVPLRTSTRHSCKSPHGKGHIDSMSMKGKRTFITFGTKWNHFFGCSQLSGSSGEFCKEGLLGITHHLVVVLGHIIGKVHTWSRHRPPTHGDMTGKS